jgi:hypothetical protein
VSLHVSEPYKKTAFNQCLIDVQCTGAI